MQRNVGVVDGNHNRAQGGVSNQTKSYSSFVLLLGETERRCARAKKFACTGTAANALVLPRLL